MSDSFATPSTVDRQVPRSWNFPDQNTGVWPFPSPGDLPVPGMKHVSYISCIGRRILYHWATREALQRGWIFVFTCNFRAHQPAAGAAKSLRSCLTLCDSIDPTRLLYPWDSPGKNTGVGCHFLLQFMKVKSESEVTQSCRLLATPRTAVYQAPPSIGFSRHTNLRLL